MGYDYGGERIENTNKSITFIANVYNTHRCYQEGRMLGEPTD
jgi:hypothetical protein